MIASLVSKLLNLFTDELCVGRDSLRVGIIGLEFAVNGFHDRTLTGGAGARHVRRDGHGVTGRLVAAVFRFRQMPVLELHLTDLHHFHLRGQLLDLLLQLLVLLIQVSGLFVDETHAIDREGGGHSSRADPIIPEISLSFHHTIELWPKYQYDSRCGTHLCPHETKKSI